jgi:hypothetical protein
VGAFVVNSRKEVLVVQERNGPLKGMKVHPGCARCLVAAHRAVPQPAGCIHQLPGMFFFCIAWRSCATWWTLLLDSRIVHLMHLSFMPILPALSHIPRVSRPMRMPSCHNVGHLPPAHRAHLHHIVW